MDDEQRQTFEASVHKKAELLKNGLPMEGEATVQLRLVLPILSALGWSAEDGSIEPEARVGKADAADFALRRSNGVRVALVETKALKESLSTDHEDQLGKYAARDTADLALLTNGRVWWLYLVKDSAKWHARRFAELDLVEDTARFARTLWMVLARTALDEGSQGVEMARGLLTQSRDNARWNRVLPDVWTQLISEADPGLIRLLQERATEQGGAGAPPEDVVRRFLVDLGGDTTPNRPPGAPEPSPARQRRRASSGEAPPPGARLTGVRLMGKELGIRKWRELLIQVAQHVSRKVKVPWRRGKRVVISSTKDDFVNQRYRDSAVQLPGGAWLDAWFGSRDCVAVARDLLEAAGLSRSDLEVFWEE